MFVCGCHGAGEPPWLHFSHYSVLSFHTVLLLVVLALTDTGQRRDIIKQYTSDNFITSYIDRHEDMS